MATIGQITTKETTPDSIDMFSMNNMKTSVLGAGSIFGTLSNLTAMDVDYEKLKLEAGYKENQALNVEFQTQQEANYLRDQFSKNVGGYQYGTARRNVKVGEAGSNVEDSAKELGYDMAKMQGNADFKAQQLRAEADRLRMGADDARAKNTWARVGDLFNGFAKTAEIFKGYEVTKGSTKETTKDIIGPLPGAPKTDKVVENIPVPKTDLPAVDTVADLDIVDKRVGTNPQKSPDTLTQLIYKDQMADPVSQNIFMLANAGKTPKQIAKETGKTEAEVAMILKDKKRG